jgi:hypothetical protein
MKKGVGNGEWGVGMKKGVGDRGLKEETENGEQCFFPNPHSPFPTPVLLISIAL